LTDEGYALGALLGRFPRAGRVEWIGIRPRYRADVVGLEAVEARIGEGLEGDHFAGGKREVTLVQAEHLAVVAALLGRKEVAPALVRRNIVVSRINLLALKDRRFSIGTAVLEGNGPCAPCSRMEESLGQGGYNAMRGHGGITARIVTGGRIGVGDEVLALAE
jgi:MOSC domain-containing protein YiiM